jgi:hypothetical protein
MKKAIIFLCVMTASALASADNGAGESFRQNMFNQFKELRIAGIQGRMAIDQTALSCVQAAQKHEDMKACEEAAHKSMESLKQSQQQKIQTLQQTVSQERQQHQQEQQLQQHQQGGLGVTPSVAPAPVAEH